MMKLANDSARGSSWITAQLRQAIQGGQYGHGERLPAERRELPDPFTANEPSRPVVAVLADNSVYELRQPYQRLAT